MVEIWKVRLGTAIDRAAGEYPDSVGWVFEDEKVTFSQMKERSDRVARALLAQGIGKGDAIAVWMPNLAEFAYLQFAAARIGAVAVAINTRSKSFEVHHTLKQGDVKAIFMAETFLKHDFKATLVEVAGGSARNGHIDSTELPALGLAVSIGRMQDDANLSWESFLGSADAIAEDQLADAECAVTPNDPLLLQYTSGTTSKPKGALLNHIYVLNYGVQFLERMGIARGESYMNTQPFYHIGGSCACLPVPLVTGVVMVSANHYVAERVLELIEREKCVGRSGYSAMYLMEMNSPAFAQTDLTSLRAGWCVGSAPVLKKIKNAFGLADLFQIYGSTEGAGTSGRVGDGWALQSLSCGTALDGTEIRIVGREDRLVRGPGQTGEIQLRGWCIMNEYYKLPEATEHALEPDGWLNTGDLGRLDEAGNLYFEGRVKDMLKVGGENVSAEEVEAVLLSHPDIVQASVIGTADERLGEVVMAIVECLQPISEGEIIDYCKPRLANFRVPKHVRFTTDWPLTALGKIQKNVLRNRFADRRQMV
jgi:fatty-acyl-CoA synthase/long-chain acyl-CoA synthetase